MDECNQDGNFVGDDQSKNAVIYIDYVDLLPFEGQEREDLFCEAHRYSSSDDWKEQFFSTDLLRRINKYEPSLIEEHSMDIFPFVENCINSPRTSLGKNTLVLCQELYMSNRTERMIEFTCNLIPILVAKVGFESKFLSAESLIALQFCAASMAYPQCIDALLAHADYRNCLVKTQVWKAITICIQNLQPEMFNLEGDLPDSHSFGLFLETICKALVVSKSTEAKESTKILKYIGKETVKSLCDRIFDEQNQHKTERIMNVFQPKKKGRTLKRRAKNHTKGKSKADFFICVE
ncbi:unnamed protein product [Moneuplotes crassus]|uniref:Uncharacterized protein n=1 Tax=Euplotes crassus TaxID=5936 RepID=A0AAD2CWF4_EUPCR|nr:unnamed protein product [Moneuplotes crassus]